MKVMLQEIILYSIRMMNFCSAALKPTVMCSAISTDGYDVTNLISSDVSKYQKGFLAYTAIKPPVTITIEFYCNINLSHVVLWPQIGCQKSTGFEILASSTSVGLSTDTLPTGKTGSDVFQRIVYGYLKDETGILFCRRIHNSEQQLSTSYLNGFARITFTGTSNSYALLNNVRSLQIKIIKTNSSVPALARVEVWGYPSKSCPKSVHSEVLTLWKSQTPKRKRVPCKPTSKLEEDTLVTSSPKGFEIPEEFLDPITCTLMAFPLILPSGKVVDQITLDKHKLFEANWGRAPSDPFTGLIFTENNRPVPATTLKARIDKFLVEHSEQKELWHIPRTTGRKENSESSNKNKQLLLAEQKPHLGECCSTTSTTFSPEVKNPTFQGLGLVSTYLCHTGKHYDSVQGKAKTESSFGPVNMCNRPNSLPSSHEDEIDLSLNSVLHDTLVGLPTFIKFHKNCNNIIQQCGGCKGNVTLFKLPCSHFLCRKCLVLKKELRELSCNMCNTDFKSADPVRYHT